MVHHLIAPYALVVLRKDNSILMVQRSPHAKFAPEHFSLIGGSVEKDESFTQAIAREALEEVGVTVNPADLNFVHTFYRKGVEHELVACVFECTKWEGEPYNCEPTKHSALSWVSIDELPEKVIPAHRAVLKLIQDGCRYSEQP